MVRRANYYSPVMYACEPCLSVSQGLLVHRESVRSLRRFHPASGTPFESLATSVRLLRRLVTEQLAQDQLAVTDFWALSGIVNGITGPSSLGRLLAVTPAGMTQLLDRLERRGLVQRTRNPGDRRASLLRLTPKGRELQRRAAGRSSRFLEKLATELSPAGREGLQVVSRELDAIVARRTATTHPSE
jgi:MarR family transcriptional regulator, lower aerobic nicotinate degradation pathway regulator